MFVVTLTACVAGNPLKAWRGGTDPDDEWQDQRHEFDELADAKAFVGELHPDVTTHVELLGPDGEVLYRKDAGDDLDAAEPGVEPQSSETEKVTVETVPAAPPVMEAQ